MNSKKLTKGKLLIAEPSILNDTSFNRSVILLSEHNDEGSIGFILNKPSEFTLGDLLPDTKSDLIIYNGGPVSQENLYFVHRVPELIPESIQIAENIYWGGNFENVQKLLERNLLKKLDIRFFLGYSGWSKDQLQSELDTTSWIVIDNTYKNIFDISDHSIWKDNLLSFGGDYPLWANAPENISLN
ncbi:YqgE/AlgH family protein [Flavobacteriaceae bacterium F08102]|nr:YqgE/AlgH family protein [Flavobacteriaceae bacterium F08102]